MATVKTAINQREMMTIRGLLMRFTVTYVVLMLGASTALFIFDIQSKTSVNVAILMGAIVYVCMAFGQRNGRYLTPEEKKQVWGGTTLINMVIQFTISGLAAAATGKSSFIGTLLAAVAIVGALHAIAIYFAIRLSGKMLAKQGITAEPRIAP